MPPFALQLDSTTPEDPGIIEPCVAVLRNMSSKFYSGLAADVQVIFIGISGSYSYVHLIA